MLDTKTINKTVSKIYYPVVKFVDDTTPFSVDVSSIVRAKLKLGMNSFSISNKKFDVCVYENGFQGWVEDEHKGSFPIISTNSECIDLYPGWNLVIIKNKEFEMFFKSRFLVDNKGQFMEVKEIKHNKAFLDTSTSSVYKSAWVMINKEEDLMPFTIRDKYLDTKKLFMVESLEKILVIFGDEGRGYYRYAFYKEAMNDSFWSYSFAAFDDLGYKIDERRRCLTDINPICYLKNKFFHIEFEDPLFAFIIKRELGVSGRGLNSRDLLNLKNLDLQDYKLYSISGIEHCLGLQVLNIKGHYVSQLSEIILNLPSLKKLHLSEELYSDNELKYLHSFL